MARTFSRNSRNYAAGTYGPFSVDSLTKADTERLEGTLTVENWDPLIDPIVTVTVRWSDGSEMAASYPGLVVNRDGTPATRVVISAQVPRHTDENGNIVKRDVASGTITVQCHADLRTAITFGAV